MAQMVNNPPAMRKTQIQSLGQEDPLEEGMVNPLQCSFLENPIDRGAWQATVLFFLVDTIGLGVIHEHI